MNAVQKAICTLKDHFVSGLDSLRADFPMRLWHTLRPLNTKTFNVLRSSRINPRLSAEEHLIETFDFNKILIASLVCKVVAHEVTINRSNLRSHALEE